MLGGKLFVVGEDSGAQQISWCYSRFNLEVAALLDEGNQNGVDGEYEDEDSEHHFAEISPHISSTAYTQPLLCSGEEAYGKYSDLYTTYNNLKNIGKRFGYLQYLDSLLSVQNNPIHQKLSEETWLTDDYESCVYKYSGNYCNSSKYVHVQLADGTINS